MLDSEFKNPKQEQEKNKAENISEIGSELSGALVSGIVGLLAGPAGSIGGSVAGFVITRIAKDFTKRFLSSKESQRIGKGLTYIGEKISNNFQKGMPLRVDGFFDLDLEPKSDADEILESVLIKCKNEPQDKKIPFIANIFANVAFRNDVSASDAHHLLRISENLTYRQLCLISLVIKGKEMGQQFSWGWYLQEFPKEQTAPSFNAELRSLTNFIHAIGNTEEPPFLQPLGNLCYELMDLSEIADEDLNEVAELIKRK